MSSFSVANATKFHVIDITSTYKDLRSRKIVVLLSSSFCMQKAAISQHFRCLSGCTYTTACCSRRENSIVDDDRERAQISRNTACFPPAFPRQTNKFQTVRENRCAFEGLYSSLAVGENNYLFISKPSLEQQSFDKHTSIWRQ
jgi:hypothetical protein